MELIEFFVPMAAAPVIAKAGLLSTLGKVGGILSSVGNLFGIGRGRRQNRRNRQNMRYQHDLDKQMWDYQNEYNTPAKQMERLKAAGLNPNLMYGQGTTGNASGAPMTKPLPAYQEAVVDTTSAAQFFLQAKMQDSQIKNLDSQTKSQDIKNTLDAYSLPFAQRREVLNTIKLEKDVAKTEEEINNLIQQKKSMIADMKLKVTQADKTRIDKEIQKLDLQFFRKKKLAPSDYGLVKALYRLGIDFTSAGKYILNAPAYSLEMLNQLLLNNWK